MISVGITGGIGSGKTTVCRLFETLGVPVYYADDRAKQLMVNNEKVVEGLIKLFGNDAYLDGALNRKHISGIVFKDKEKLKQLNAIVHPAVFQDFEDWKNELPKDTVYYLKEAALLVETGSYAVLDKLVVVSAPKETRIERVIKRDGVNREQVEARMNNQLSQEAKEALADFIIDNDGKGLLIPQVLRIHNVILTQGGKHR